MPDTILHRREFLGLLACSPFLTAIQPTRTLEWVGRGSTTHSFTLILAGVSEISVEMADALFEAGCDDGTPGSCCGVASVTFTREADTFLGAIRSAIRDVRKAGLEVARVEIEAEALETVTA